MSPDVAKYGEKVIAVFAYVILAAILVAVGKFLIDGLKFLQDLMHTV